MDKDFLQLFLEKTGFPQEARAALLESAGVLEQTGQAAAIDGGVDFFYENDFNINSTEPLIETAAEKSNLSPYTVWMLFLIEAAKTAQKDYLQAGVSEEIFWDTFSDLRYKALECKEIHNVWGTFVAFWYPIFYSCDIVKLGRLEYENSTLEKDILWEKGGLSLRRGTPVKHIHIPSSGEPFDRAARLNSYRRAYQFYGEELHGGPLICLCHSWLLYPAYGTLLSPTSNILGFQRDFDIIEQFQEKEFHDAWRLFGAGYQRPLEELPERTSMQRAFKKHLLSGGSIGQALGLLVFDGDKLLTGKHEAAFPADGKNS